MSDDRKLYVNAWTVVLVVFDFRFRESCPARDAPIDRLLAAIDETLVDNIGEQSQFIGLVLGIQRDVRMFPIGNHAQPLKLSSLNAFIFESILLACLSNVRGRNICLAGFT